MKENDAFLKRLQDRKSEYNVFAWKDNRKEQMKRIKAICLFPPSISNKKT